MKLRTLAAAFAAALLVIAPAANAQQKTLKYAHFQPAKDDQPKHRAALAFKEYVEKNTNGAIKVEIYPAGQFGNDAATMEGLKLGTLEMAVAHDGAIASVYKGIAVLGIPFLYDSHQHAWRVYDSSFGTELGDDMLKRTGIRMLGIADNGVRHFTNSAKPINSPADMKGMKMRIQPSPPRRRSPGPSFRQHCSRKSWTVRKTASPTSSLRACTSIRSTSRSMAMCIPSTRTSSTTSSIRA
jgi:TRAP-type transport system periplasmic protein